MTCAHCRDVPDFFSERRARWDVRRYRKRGPLKTTAMLLRAVRDAGLPDDFTLLDIGGGVGALQHELAEEGAARIVSIDASPAYLEAARSEAVARGHADRLEQRLGDFVELSDSVEPADVVTLDRVICCYPDMPALVGASAERARRLYGLVFPREVWWVRIGLMAANVLQRLRRSDFRVYVHPTPAVLAEIERRGLKRRYSGKSFVWQVMLFERRDGGARRG